jgi:hypothetical protein
MTSAGSHLSPPGAGCLEDETESDRAEQKSKTMDADMQVTLTRMKADFDDGIGSPATDASSAR